MSKRRAIVSFEKLSAEQKKQLEKAFPDGYSNQLTSIKTPTGEVMDALIWETEEIIYLVKINKAAFRTALDDDDDDYDGDDMESDIPVGDDDDVDDSDDDVDDSDDSDDDDDDDED